MLIFKHIIAVFLSVIVLYGMSAPQIAKAGADTQEDAPLVKIEGLKGCKKDRASYGVKKTIRVVVTAYSSSWDETTGIPGKPGLITASGAHVEEGVVAYNHLPFNTRLRINAPGFEGRIFVVKDRTAKGRKNLDIWRPSKQEALNFGAQVINVEILEG